jgi:Arylsulfotransferase (ASST)
MPLPPALFLLAAFALQAPAPKPADDPKPDAKPADAKPAEAKPPEPLPKGFPKPDDPRGVLVKEAGALDGYVLLAPLRSKAIHILDLDGKVVHTWNTSNTPGAATHFLPNGNLLRAGQVEANPRFHGGGIGGRIQELDWDGKVVWNFDLDSDVLTQHHDVLPIQNGNVLMIAWEYHSKAEAIAHGRMPDLVSEEGLWTDVVLEIKPSRPVGGSVVWMWRSWDHLVQDQDPKLPGYGKIEDHPGRIDINFDCRHLPKTESDEERAKKEQMAREMKRLGYAGDDEDKPRKGAKKAEEKPANKPAEAAAPPKGPEVEADWMHTNSVDYDPEQDLIVLSSPHMCEILVIDHSTSTAEAATGQGGRWKQGGALLYRYGNARNYGLGEASDRKLFYQHNAQWLPGSKPGELHVLVYNNGSKRPGNEYSSVDEIVLPFDPKSGFKREAGWAFGPEKPLWSYAEPEKFYSPFISGAQRLPNGDTLVCEGVKGRTFQVDRNGKVVWDFWSPLGGEVEPSKTGGRAPANALFRATWLPKDYAGLKGRL